MKKLGVLIKTSRPISWVFGPLLFLAGLFYSGTSINTLSLIQCLLLSFPASVFVYGINDVYDYESDRHNPRKGGIQGGILKPGYHGFVKKTSFFMILLLFASSLITQNFYNIVLMISLLFFGYSYSAPPMRLKNRPFLDSFSNGVIVLLTLLLGYSFSGIISVPLKILFVGFFTMGVHAYATIPDYSSDRKAGDKTISVVYGKRTTAFFSTCVFLLTYLLGGFETLILNYYIFLCTFISLLVFFYPSEKLASALFKLMVVGFVVTGIVYFL